MDYRNTDLDGLSVGYVDDVAIRACVSAKLGEQFSSLKDVLGELAKMRLEVAGEWDAAEEGQTIASLRPAQLSAEASSPRPSGCLPADEHRIGDRGPIDLDVAVRIGGRTLVGEVMLVPDEQTGGQTYRPYGDGPDTWISSALLRALHELTGDRDYLRDVIDVVVEAACAAI